MDIQYLAGIPLQLLIAFIVDLLIGDPRWFPHPVKAIGLLIEKSETSLRKLTSTKGGELFCGAVMVIAVVSVTYVFFYFINYYTNKVFGNVFIVGGRFALSDIIIGIIGSFSIAYCGLRDSVVLVYKLLQSGDTEGSRKALSSIVGRDTHQMEQPAIIKAAIESLSENLSDGVIAPMFYFAIGGLPLAFAYKAINTIDSMVGYKNTKYLYFGKTGAKLDDITNFIPSRLTAFLIVAGTLALKFISMLYYSVIYVIIRKGDTDRAKRLSVYKSIMVLVRDGGKHPSPNAGRPEAAMAGALGIALGGASYYSGILVNKSVIGDDGGAVDLVKIADALQITSFAAAAGFALMPALSIFVRVPVF
ncbi:MAG: adenosylcobinamide-phosphate synthase CbiB [Nitrospirae bacterium YQR-1]